MDLLTTEDAAARLGVSTRRVRSLIEQGDLVAERVGRMYLIRAESVAELAMRRASGRSLSSRMSWAVLLSDLGRTNWGVVGVERGLSCADRQRVLTLRGRAVEDWAWLACRRTTTARYAVRDAYVGRLLDDSRRRPIWPVGPPRSRRRTHRAGRRSGGLRRGGRTRPSARRLPGPRRRCGTCDRSRRRRRRARSHPPRRRLGDDRDDGGRRPGRER